ncbi:Type II secretory pathway [Prochlorococcus marinus str. MIT 9302]|uniref:Type II secretory pathway n=1 Tax=Prochlorococcus marinus str. MIT 9302 TaxID=74545 RepID=A0A0A2AB61_PROMR|nr:type II secretion system F family protein [Prochlorococcus marinus]KGF97648.1 Type II secretory pathway [Prochlorococcus marinus str. MIT 9302]
MNYSFIEDPKIRGALERKREESNSIKSDKKLNTEINNKEVSNSTKIKVKKNKKFESLKAKKKLDPKKKLKTPSTKALAIATKQLSSMIRTGLPLLEALNILAESNENKTLKYIFRDASMGISRGSTFVSMLEKYPEVFNEMYLALVSAGETAGLLPDVLDREAGLLESLAKIKGQISSALAYPIAIFTLTIAVIIIMLVFVIPIFVDMYASSGADLPGLTQILVDASNAIKDPSFLIKVIPVLVILIFFLKRQSKTSSFINWRDKTLLKLPITKDLVTKSCLANFSRTLSALNSAGVPILESLTISKRTLGNKVFQRIADKMNTEIQAGQPIYKVLATEEPIPIMFTSMFRIGEETGELSEMVNKLADFYEDEVSTSVKSLTSILEPLMIVFVAGVVAFILVAMYLPMFNMMSTVS